MGFLGKGTKEEQTATAPANTQANTQASPKKAEAKEKGMSQKDAVFQEVQKLVRSKNITVHKGKAVAEFLTKEHRKEIVDALMSGFRNKKYPLKDSEGNRQKLADDKLLRAYTIGLLKNWLERDKRLQNQNGEFLQA